MFSLEESKERVVELGIAKVNKSLKAKLSLGFIAGAMISFGYIAYLKAVNELSQGVGALVGAALFPIGLLVILLAGGELITGNMMVVGTAFINKKVSFKEMVINWIHITLANALGAIFIAYSAKYLGIFDSMNLTLETAALSKMDAGILQIILSGMFCNWFVGLSVWLNIAAKDGAAKVIGICFPVMIFVYLGFQHSVANTFLLTANQLVNNSNVLDILNNLMLSYLGNIFGALIFVSGLYSIATND